MTASAPARGRSVLTLLGLGLTVAGVLGVVAVSIPLVMQLVAPARVIEPDRPVYAEPKPGADPVAAALGEEEADPVPGQPLRLVIPAVGLDVAVGSMRTPRSGRIDPPTPGSAYWIRDYGLVGPAGAATAYIAGHTFRGSGSAVFNPLFDRDTRDAVVGEGDVVDVQTLDAVERYTITAVARYVKSTVEQQRELWENVPGRLVIVACQYNGDASSTENLVIYAQLQARG